MRGKTRFPARGRRGGGGDPGVSQRSVRSRGGRGRSCCHGTARGEGEVEATAGVVRRRSCRKHSMCMWARWPVYGQCAGRTASRAGTSTAPRAGSMRMGAPPRHRGPRPVYGRCGVVVACALRTCLYIVTHLRKRSAGVDPALSFAVIVRIVRGWPCSSSCNS